MDCQALNGYSVRLDIKTMDDNWQHKIRFPEIYEVGTWDPPDECPRPTSARPYSNSRRRQTLSLKQHPNNNNSNLDGSEVKKRDGEINSDQRKKEFCRGPSPPSPNPNVLKTNKESADTRAKQLPLCIPIGILSARNRTDIPSRELHSRISQIANELEPSRYNRVSIRLERIENHKCLTFKGTYCTGYLELAPLLVL